MSTGHYLVLCEEPLGTSSHFQKADTPHQATVRDRGFTENIQGKRNSFTRCSPCHSIPPQTLCSHDSLGRPSKPNRASSQRSPVFCRVINLCSASSNSILPVTSPKLLSRPFFCWHHYSRSTKDLQLLGFSLLIRKYECEKKRRV